MIVPGMSLAEIKQSLIKDYQTDLRSKLNSIEIMYKRKFFSNGHRNYTETIPLTAKSLNKWRIIAECKIDHVHLTPYLIYQDRVGLCVVHLSLMTVPIGFMHFNSHFFTRYKERAKIKPIKPEEVIKLFFKTNSYLTPCYITQEDNSEQLFTPLNGGLGLGIYHELDNIYEFKTFVDDSLLGENQKKQIGEVYMETLKGIMAALQDPNRKVRDFY